MSRTHSPVCSRSASGSVKNGCAPKREAAAAAERKRTEREALLRELGALFAMANAHQRGLAFERLLNQIFKLDGLNVREGFALSSEHAQPRPAL